MPSAVAFTAPEASVDATASNNVGASVSAIVDAALAKVPAELRDEARAVLGKRGVHPDVLTCIEAVAGYHDLVPLPQAKWLMQSLVAESEPPAIPLSLTQALVLLKRGGPLPARGPLHTLALVGLVLDPNAASDIAKASLTTLQELFYCVGPKNPLTPTIYSALTARREAMRPQVMRHVSPRTALLFNDSFDGGNASSLKAPPPVSFSADTLARRFIARGRELLAGGDMHIVRQKILAASVLSQDEAACLAGSFSNNQKDGYNRIVAFNALVEVLRLTTGEVFQVCSTIHQRDANARPQFRGTVNRPESTAHLPVFPLQPGASYSAEIYANPRDAGELFHEMGHAFECVRPDVLSAALAYRQSLAIGRPRFTNDLNVIYKIAPDAATQRKMLEHIAARELPSLADTATLHSVFDSLGLSERIDAVTSDANWQHLRPYSPNEQALPVVGDPYIGSVSPQGGTTEVVSLGMEALATADSMQAALATRPDHVAFIIGALDAARAIAPN